MQLIEQSKTGLPENRTARKLEDWKMIISILH